MKCRFFFGAVVLSLMTIVVVGCSQGPWETYESPDGDFTILFPGIPEVKTETQQVGADQMVITHYDVGQKYGVFGAKYGVVVVELQAANPEAVQFDDNAALIGAKSGVRKEGGKIISEYDITMAGYDGWEFEVETKTSESTLRMFRKDLTIYTFEVARRKGKDFSEETEKFFDSFQLVWEEEEYDDY